MAIVYCVFILNPIVFVFFIDFINEFEFYDKTSTC